MHPNGDAMFSQWHEALIDCKAVDCKAQLTTRPRLKVLVHGTILCPRVVPTGPGRLPAVVYHQSARSSQPQQRQATILTNAFNSETKQIMGFQKISSVWSPADRLLEEFLRIRTKLAHLIMQSRKLSRTR